MRLALLYKLLAFVHFITLSQHSHVQEAKRHIRAELNGIWREAGGKGGAGGSHGRSPWPSTAVHGGRPHPPHRYYHHQHQYRNHRSHHHHHHNHNSHQHGVEPATYLLSGSGRWSGRRHAMERHQHHFTTWTAWSLCGGWDCVQRRERYCRHKRKCGYTKHVEERKCWGVCEHHQQHQQQQQHQHEQHAPTSTQQHNNNSPQAIIITTGGANVQPSQAPPATTTTGAPTPPPPTTTDLPWLEDNDIELVHDDEYGEEHVVGGGGGGDVDEYVPRLSAPPPPSAAIRIPVLEQGSLGDYADEGAFDVNELHPKPHNQGHRGRQHFDRYRDQHDQHDDRDYRDHNESDAFDDDGSYDFYALRSRRHRSRHKQHERQQQLLIDASDYRDLAADEHDDEWEQSGELARLVQPVRLRSGRDRRVRNKRGRRGRAHQLQDDVLSERNLEATTAPDDGIEGDMVQYEDFDFGRESDSGRQAAERRVDSQYSESYEDTDYSDVTAGKNGTLQQPSRERATPTEQLPRHRRIYSKWSRWTKCSPKCTTRRYKKCRVREQCGREVLREIAYCYTEGSFCQQWLQAQVQKIPAYELRPGSATAATAPASPLMASRRREISNSGGGTDNNAVATSNNNAIVSAQHDYIMNGKGYRGPEYTPQKLRCGIASVRNTRRHSMYNMLKIIGGKATRKGEWPWQVAIFNRFKEAFCGGTLVAPQWVLTAAHCVRKVLYVRIGEHNLDYEDGTEVQLRVLKSFKHPNFDKKTVDSDVALLKLPKPVNASTWVGFSCLPRPYQPLPKNMDCTVIGWGKRRNRDVAGTSVLHQAEVPIISMDNCRSVYHDYTITKNMFCAGHKRGRIDTCAGDSGGPLLCRDTTKPNHPWTIFGITSFGDGCAKRNKFGIYAKVPNYVDWVWSVINCNGNCKLHRGALAN